MSVIEREQQQVGPEREERARVLEAAALEIEVRGWCQRKLVDDAGRVCALWAISKAAPEALVGNVWGNDVAVLKLVVAFNDDPGRTAGEVTFVLRWRAAEIRDGR
jgi:hypothetical protein